MISPTDTQTFFKTCLLIVKGGMSTGSPPKACAKLRVAKVIWSSSSKKALKDYANKKMYL
jgi:hypothetical protein